MTVHIQSECGSCVTQIILYCLDVIARLNGCYGIGVSQIVESRFGTTDIGYHLFEVTIDNLRTQMVSQFVCEYESAIFVAFPITKSVGKLLLFDLTEYGDYKWSKCYRSSLAVFRREQAVFPTRLPNLLELFIDQHRTSVQIHTFPQESTYFTFPHP